VFRVGLTGGIGSGKSEVSRRLAGYGAVVIDADAIARDVVAPGTPGLADVVAAFGDGVLTPGGELDRERLGEIVFADPEQRARLNAIVHPLVGARMAEQEAAAGSGAIVVHDVPLIAENQISGRYDVVVVVDAPEHLRLSRLIKRRGMSADQVRARMAAQASREQRLAVADLIVDNSGSLAELDHQVAYLWAVLRRRARRAEQRA
jgi:dephospho-CoA kinase